MHIHTSTMDFDLLYDTKSNSDIRAIETFRQAIHSSHKKGS